MSLRVLKIAVIDASRRPRLCGSLYLDGAADDDVSAEKAGKDATLFRKDIYSARINGLIAEMRKPCVEGEPCGPDYDFLVEGQDFQIRDLKVKLLARDGEKAKVEAEFKNLGSPERKIFSLVRRDRDWRIDEIETKGDQSNPNLTKLLMDTTESQKK